MASISLITICWNSAKTLRRAVESVLAQTRRPDEYLFVDGGSTDGTIELLDELCGNLRAAGVAARVVAQERRPGEAGIPSAWNQGLAQAKGDVIGLLNSDDWYEPIALQTALDGLAEHPDTGGISCGVRFVNPDGTPAGVMLFQGMAALAWKMTVPHPGFFVRRTTYDRLGLYDTRYRISADYDFVWRCREEGIALAATDEITTNMELGGLANSSRALARRETRDIALRHGGSTLLVWGAWLLRALLGR